MSRTLQYPLPLGTRADSLSALQNLGQPLTRLAATYDYVPYDNPIPSQLDTSLDAETTRTKKCCKGPLPIDRIASELYPIPADSLKDLRPVPGVFGAPSRLDGRDPVGYRR